MKLSSLAYLFSFLGGFLGACVSSGPAFQSKPGVFLENEPPLLDLNSTIWSKDDRIASAGYYYLLGEYKGLKGEMETSRELFKAAYELDSVRFLAEKHLAAELAAGPKQNSLNLARKLSLQYPKSPRIQLLLAQAYMINHDLEAASRTGKRAVKLDPHSEQAYILVATLEEKQGRLENSATLAKELLSVKPNSIYAWSFLAKIYLKQAEYPMALEAAKKAHLLDPNNQELLLLYAFLCKKNKRKQQAFELYRTFFLPELKHPQIVARTLTFLKIYGSFENSITELDELAKHPQLIGSTGLHVQRVFILWELNRINEATELLADLLKQNPKTPQLRFLSGMSYERGKKWQRAIEEYGYVSQESSYFIPSRYKMSELLRKQKRFQEALTVLDSTIEHKYGTWEFYILAANIQADQEQYADAITTLQSGVKRFPGKVQLLFTRGVMEEKINDMIACEKTMREVIAKDPTFSSAYNFLGYLFAERGENLEEAKQLILNALILKPNDGYYLDSLGWVFYQQGEYQDALKYLTLAAQLLPKEAVIQEHLGDAHSATRQSNEARRAYEQALELYNDDRDKERVQEKLGELN